MTTVSVKNVSVLANEKNQAKTFANSTQANAAALVAIANGFDAVVFQFPTSRVRYVKIIHN